MKYTANDKAKYILGRAQSYLGGEVKLSRHGQYRLELEDYLLYRRNWNKQIVIYDKHSREEIFTSNDYINAVKYLHFSKNIPLQEGQKLEPKKYSGAVFDRGQGFMAWADHPRCY